jgi:predicted enzyme related to lactoylglutathione lyase
VASLYQLDRAHLDHGVPSHWTPYVRVADIGEAAGRAVALGGTLLAGPLLVPGLAQVAVLDPIGARIGLWQPSGGAPAP